MMQEEKNSIPGNREAIDLLSLKAELYYHLVEKGFHDGRERSLFLFEKRYIQDPTEKR